MNILLKLISFGLYPFILVMLAFFLAKKQSVVQVWKQHYQKILLHSFMFISVLVIVALVFFHFEDTIYYYDFSGYWVRSLELKQFFHQQPLNIFTKLYQSMLFDDYSYLANLYLLPMMHFGSSFKYFVLANIITFLFPLSILLQLLFYRFTNKHHIILLSLLTFYPLYFTLFSGDVAISGLIFIVVAILLVDKQFCWVDALFLNFVGFNLIFLRRWFLFLVIILYPILLLKLITDHKLTIKKSILYTILSGILLLIVLLFAFRPFVMHLLQNNLKEAYQFYNHNNKLYAFINYYSPIFILISLVALYHFVREKKYVLVISLLTSILVPFLLFTRIQSFEYHHYHLFNIQMITLVIVGVERLIRFKKSIFLLFCVLFFQVAQLAFPTKTPLFTEIKRVPINIGYVKEVKELSEYLVSISSESWQSAYLSSGSNLLNDDMIRNSLLPDISQQPKIDSSVNDLRDGFPKDLQYISYVLVIQPIQYLNPEYQKMYAVISDAIENHPEISKIYEKINQFKIDDMEVSVYERTGDFTPTMKQYFYQKMLEFYPEHSSFFSYILD